MQAMADNARIAPQLCCVPCAVCCAVLCCAVCCVLRAEDPDSPATRHSSNVRCLQADGGVKSALSSALKEQSRELRDQTRGAGAAHTHAHTHPAHTHTHSHARSPAHTHTLARQHANTRAHTERRTGAPGALPAAPHWYTLTLAMDCAAPGTRNQTCICTSLGVFVRAGKC